MSRLIKPLSTFFAITLLLTSIVIVVVGGAAGGKFASARSHSVLPSSLVLYSLLIILLCLIPRLLQQMKIPQSRSL